METILLKAKSEGLRQVIFGDIFLEDPRVYRENKLAEINMKTLFPLLKTDTIVLMNEIIKQGFKTIICCINDGYFNEVWVGREIDNSFINHLPKNVDSCVENFEYHTFLLWRPGF